jgi:hypothetical protein
MNQAFAKWTGAALCVAAVLLVVINAGLTPRLPDGEFSHLGASQIFLLRQSLAALTALLMTFGIVGIFSAQADRVSFFGRFAFLLAFAGGMALFATEWAQIFVIRDLALNNPAAVDQLEDAPGMTLFDIGALAAFSMFALGWIMLAISMLFARVSKMEHHPGAGRLLRDARAWRIRRLGRGGRKRVDRRAGLRLAFSWSGWADNLRRAVELPDRTTRNPERSTPLARGGPLR